MFITSRQLNTLQKGLYDLAKAVEGGTRELTNRRDGEVEKDLAPLLLDYLVIRELLGRGDPKRRRTFEARRTPRTGVLPSFLVLPEWPGLPEGGRQVAVFIRPDAPAETVDIRTPHRGAHNAFPLRNVRDVDPIVRLELQRDDGFPIALGPRLAAAV